MSDNTHGFPQASAERRGNAIVTRDHDRIRQWAARHQAQPAAREATTSGPATIDVRDHGVGIRFNFPGFGRFRPITWDEWFDDFDSHGLMFAYEREVTDRAHELSEAHGRTDGRDKEDWYGSERKLGSGPMARYRLIIEGEADQREPGK